MASVPHRLRALSFAAGILWCALVALGFWQLFRYETRAGAPATAGSWPPAAAESVPLELDHERPSLLVFVHPQCPCSRATIAELDRLVTRIGARVRTELIVYDDPALGAEWAHGALVQAAERIPGVRVTFDAHGQLAQRFGSTTSGETLLFARDGRLLFSGGITAGRGCEGDNAGCAAILAVLDDPTRAPLTTPVFGCSLVAPERVPVNRARDAQADKAAAP